MEVLLGLLFLLAAMTGRSGAMYCLCKAGLNTTALQTTLDYACGAGANCAPILQNGACYLPNTVADHCNYAANSYYQKTSQSGGTCDFTGTAYLSQTPPSDAVPGCVYPSNSSTSGSTPTPPSSTTTPPSSTTTPPSSTTTPPSPTSYSSPPFGTGISPSDNGNGSGRETISFFDAVAALVFWSIGRLVLG